MPALKQSHTKDNPGRVLGLFFVVGPYFIATFAVTAIGLFAAFGLISNPKEGDFYAIIFTAASPLLTWSCYSLISAFWFDQRGFKVTVGLAIGLLLCSLLAVISAQLSYEWIVSNPPYGPGGRAAITFYVFGSSAILQLYLLVTTLRERRRMIKFGDK